MPDRSTCAHNGLLDFRPKKVRPDMTASCSHAKEAVSDDALFKLKDKVLRPLCRLVMPAFEMIQLPGLSEEYESDPQEIVNKLQAQKRLLKCFATHTFCCCRT